MFSESGGLAGGGFGLFDACRGAGVRSCSHSALVLDETVRSRLFPAFAYLVSVRSLHVRRPRGRTRVSAAALSGRGAANRVCTHRRVWDAADQVRRQWRLCRWNRASARPGLPGAERALKGQIRFLFLCVHSRTRRLCPRAATATGDELLCTPIRWPPRPAGPQEVVGQRCERRRTGDERSARERQDPRRNEGPSMPK